MKTSWGAPRFHSFWSECIIVDVSICPSAWRRSTSRASSIKGAVSPLPLEGDGCDNLLPTSISTPTTTTSYHDGPGQHLLHLTMPDSPIFKKRRLPFRSRAAASPGLAGSSSTSARSEGPNGILTRVTRSLAIWCGPRIMSLTSPAPDGKGILTDSELHRLH